MTALGAAGREPTGVDDAWAVARETMRRARANVETIIERLDALGYQFWDGRQGSALRSLGGPLQRPLQFGGALIEPGPPGAMLPKMFAYAKAQPPQALTAVMF